MRSSRSAVGVGDRDDQLVRAARARARPRRPPSSRARAHPGRAAGGGAGCRRGSRRRRVARLAQVAGDASPRAPGADDEHPAPAVRRAPPASGTKRTNHRERAGERRSGRTVDDEDPEREVAEVARRERRSRARRAWRGTTRRRSSRDREAWRTARRGGRRRSARTRRTSCRARSGARRGTCRAASSVPRPSTYSEVRGEERAEDEQASTTSSTRRRGCTATA